ncbi:sulfatase family protein [Sphingobacterium endophyticum]|uniref:sulfatase family protein n=1 Tax=Sphingobacterium endophyticum TaxID=2546448 RepID=UPI0012E2FC44|nr:sulfatase [Sphingobacterium endophyticum]
MNKAFTFILFCALSISMLYGQKRPNIVIIISDDHSYQTISAYGSKIGSTPNIDRIAKDGLLFNRAYVNNSLCGPSRASLLTGKYSHKNGYKENEKSHFEHSQNSFVKELRKAGYRTSWIGKQHLGDTLEGFDYFDVLINQGHYFNPNFKNQKGEMKREKGYVSDIVTEKAIGWMESLDREKPFCMILGHKATHREWNPDPQDFGKNDGKKFPLPDNFYDNYEGREAAKIQEMQVSKDMKLDYDLKLFKSEADWMKESNFFRMDESDREKYRSYYAKVKADFESRDFSDPKKLAEWKYQRYMTDYLNTAESMDRNIGKVLDYLDEKGLAENTLVIYMSDQGFYMGEHGWFDKRFMYEESFRTPMMLRYPKHIKKSKKVNDLLMTIDIAPTMLELAGVAVPSDMQGESFEKIIEGKEGARKQLYYHYYEDGIHNVSPHFGVSDGQYKLIRFYNKVDSWELYDLKKDSKEMNNLYNNAKYAEKQAEMMRKLKEEIKKQDDAEAMLIFEAS